jgi:deoxyribonuclease-1
MKKALLLGGVVVVCAIGVALFTENDEEAAGEDNASVDSDETPGAAKTPEPAKKKLTLAGVETTAIEEIYADNRVSFFCGCNFDDIERVDISTCGYKPDRVTKKGPVIRWVRVVPPDKFGGHRKCWKSGSPECKDAKGRRLNARQCCWLRGVDDVYRKAFVDLHNLVPVVSEIAQARKGLPFGEVDGEPREFGTCDFEVGEKTVEPAESIRGDIARVYLYMAHAYEMPLEESEEAMFEKWHKADPPSDWERERNLRIKEVQKVGNKFIE